MVYYILRNSLNRKITGKYPQTVNAEYSCSVWDEPRFIDHEAVDFKKVNFNPITAKAILAKKAKLTDYMYPGGMGFSKKPLISGKLKAILEITDKQGLQIYNSPVIYQGSQVEDYWVLNPYIFDMQAIDFKKAEVYLMEMTFTKVKKLDVLTYKDFVMQKAIIKEKGYPYSIYIENVHILENITSDFLVLENVEGGVMYLVSERLKQHLEAEGITGIEYQPSYLNFNEWKISGGAREKLYGKA
ncbi:hypothetical protein [Mucilaginibacter sp. AK015]|uniref:hypothetical protein n=1 Tax=Mucilaginibacter sp. AK015 TaxID=2723072 RepID=UPI0016133D71|nr:hypothetical protein [Mucilaginibacter sp. AK015]MBB5395604.1 hypothetical protein [Mucilaginibacter sp. AK015]